MQNCLCVCAAAAGGTKYRGVCSDQRGDVGIAPYATRRDVSFIIVGADAHVGPSVIGIVLQIPRLPTGKGFQNLGSARFWVLFPRGKSTPPEADPTNSTASPLFVHIAHQSLKILCKFISNSYLHYLAKVILY